MRSHYQALSPISSGSESDPASEPNRARHSGFGADDAPEIWRCSLAGMLVAEESVITWLVTDLDRQREPQDELIVLTNRRWLTSSSATVAEWDVWSHDEVQNAEVRERAGLGQLDLFGKTKRLRHWRYTVDRTPDAERLIRTWGALRDGTYTAAPDEKRRNSEYAQASPKVGSPQQRTGWSLWRLRRFTTRQRGWIALGLFLTMASTVAGLIPPYLTMPLLDEVLIPGQSGVAVADGKAVGYLLGLTGAAFVSWILAWMRGYVMTRTSERISADLRYHTYSHLNSLSLDYFGARRTGDLIARVGSDTDRICNFLSYNIVDWLADLVMIVGTTAILLWISPVLALATLVPFPFIALLAYWVRDRLRRGFERGGRAWSELTSVLADAVSGVRVVKAFAQEEREVMRFQKVNLQVVAANDRVNTLWAFTGPTVSLLNQIGLLIVWSFGVLLVFRGSITVGILTAFLAYITRFYMRLESMTRMIHAFQRAEASARRIFEILDQAPAVPEPAAPVDPQELRGGLELCEVSFRHGPRTVLHGINLTIAPGEMIGLVGPSGAGKTTLMNLICRFYDVHDGAIKADGVDIRSYPIAAYRRGIGIVLQEPFLFHGGIAENLAYGRPDASIPKILRAARAAHAHQFILRLPDAYDARVGERGQALSGGERQRLSIARALLIDPRILLLDEATASVDSETERHIQAALNNLIQGRTTIAIAHRLSTLRRARRLAVLDHGRIVAIGTHDELLADPQSVYSRIYHGTRLKNQFPPPQNDVFAQTDDNEVVDDDANVEPPDKPEKAWIDAFGRLTVVTPDGREHAGVEPVRGFPLSAPRLGVALRDARGREIAWLPDLDQLPASVREPIDHALTEQTWAPRIQGLRGVHERSSGRIALDLTTSRGPLAVTLPNIDHLRAFGEHGVVFTDIRGIRFHLQDVRILPLRDRRLLERYLWIGT